MKKQTWVSRVARWIIAGRRREDSSWCDFHDRYERNGAPLSCGQIAYTTTGPMRQERRVQFGTDGGYRYKVKMRHGELVVRIADFEGGGR